MAERRKKIIGISGISAGRFGSSSSESCSTGMG